MLHFPNAKINLGLFVTRKRPDGYHDLETIFYPLPQLKDALEVVPAEQSSIRVSGRDVPGAAEENLVWKALLLMRQRFGDRIPALQVQLHKVIPMGAGLGGGSADGAFMLRLLNKFAGLELPEETLAALALELGSDCPFFIYNTPQFAMGRGELLRPVAIDLGDYSIQVICPRIPVSTADAFRNIVPAAAAFDLAGLADIPLAAWKDVLRNDFETTVFARYPRLGLLKDTLYRDGAIYASMTGSGSALYGIFPKGKQSTIETGDEQEVFYCE